jgi:Flp pilus assembly protein TadD
MFRRAALWLVITSTALSADLYTQAVAAFRSGQFDAALTFLERLDPKQSDTPAAQNLKALACMETKRYVQALEAIGRARALDPRNPNYAYNHGLFLLEKRDYPESRNVFAGALQELGPDARLLSGYGEALLHLHEYAEAEKQLKRSVDMAPTNVSSWIVLARLYHSIGDGTNLGQAARRALLLDSSNTQAAYYYGVYLIDYSADPSQGARYIQKSIELDPRFPEGLRAWGRILVDQERWSDAVGVLERAIAADPTDRQSYFLLYKAYRRAGHAEKAEQALDRYRSLLP